MIYVILDSARNLRAFLASDDKEYADWAFAKHGREGDTLEAVKPDVYQILCEKKRYKEACLRAAAKLKAKAAHPDMFAKTV